MLHEVKLAVIGYGGIGSAHTGFIAGGGVAGMTLAAVCDINENRLDVVRDRFPGVRCVTDFHDLLDGSIYDLPESMIVDEGETIKLAHLPITDSALLLTFGEFYL